MARKSALEVANTIELQQGTAKKRFCTMTPSNSNCNVKCELLTNLYSSSSISLSFFASEIFPFKSCLAWLYNKNLKNMSCLPAFFEINSFWVFRAAVACITFRPLGLESDLRSRVDLRDSISVCHISTPFIIYHWYF